MGTARDRRPLKATTQCITPIAGTRRYREFQFIGSWRPIFPIAALILNFMFARIHSDG